MTIMTGHSRCNAKHFSGYLLRTENGQSVIIHDVVGLVGDNIKGWFEQMAAMAVGSQADNYFYHFTLNPRIGEEFTPEQRQIAVATALRNLGLDGQPYFIIEHAGIRPHYHGIVLRVDLDTGKAVSDSNNYAIHMRTADELERRFGHKRTERGRGPDGPNPKEHEVQRGAQTGIDRDEVKELLTRLWRTTDSGKALAAAIEDHGFILARGDSRGYVVIDEAGDVHSLAKRVAGARTKDINARMKDVPLGSLPSVEEARKLAKERAAERSTGADVALPDPALALTPDHADAQKQRRQREAAGRESSAPDRQTPQKAGPAWPPLRVQGEVVTSLDQFAEASRRGMEANIRRTQTQLVHNLGEFADAITAAMEANGGEPYGGDGLSFWQRSLMFLQEAPGRIAAWVKDALGSFVERLMLNRQGERDDPEPGIER